MEKNSVNLLLNLDILKKNFSNLSDELFKSNEALKQSLIPPSVELAEQIRICNQEFEQLRSQVLQLAESVGLTKPPTDKIISVRHLETLLKNVIEAEKIVGEKVKLRALEILDQILRIRHSDNIDFVPLNKCQEQARELHHVISNLQVTELNSQAKALVSGEHPLSKFLRLIIERESSDYQGLEQLQTDVAQLLGMSVALAALTGKLFLLQEFQSTTITINTEEVAILEVSESAQDSGKVDNPITQQEIPHSVTPIPEVSVKKQTESQEIAASILKSNLEESHSALEYLIWQLIYEEKISLAFHLGCCWEINFLNIKPKLPSWIIRAVILGHHVRYEVGFGEIANFLMDDFANFSESSFAHGEIEYNQAVSLFLAASALRPALLAPNTNASDILNHLRLGEGLNRLFEYCQIIANYGCQHYALNTLRGRRNRLKTFVCRGGNIL